MDGKRGFTRYHTALGFTLIELLIVIVVLGVLATVVMIAINPLGMINSANLAKVKTFSASVENLLSIAQVGKWSFEESASLSKDTSGYGNNANWSASGVISETESSCGLGFGKCLRFDSASSGELTTNSPFNNLGDVFTLSAWAKGTIGMFIVNHYNRIDFGGVEKGWSLYAGSNSVTLQINGQVGIRAVNVSPSPQDGSWHHFVGVKNGSTGILYMDGKRIFFSSSLPAAVTADYHPSQPLRFMWSKDGPSHSSGTIDEVAIYSQALLSSQIKQLYVQGLIKHQLAME